MLVGGQRSNSLNLNFIESLAIRGSVATSHNDDLDVEEIPLYEADVTKLNAIIG